MANVSNASEHAFRQRYGKSPALQTVNSIKPRTNDVPSSRPPNGLVAMLPALLRNPV